jgi:hypothetical protein
MGETRIPWWLVVLIAIGVAGLAVWQSPVFKPKLRTAAGALGLIYLALLAFAIGGDPRSSTTVHSWTFPDLMIAAMCGVSIVSAVLLAGRPPFRGQMFWLGLMSLVNGGICFATNATVVGAVLTLMGTASAILLVNDCRGSQPPTLRELWPVADTAADPLDDSPGLHWLAGGAGLATAIVLIGTIYHALHTESSRAMSTRRHSALPSVARIRSILTIDADPDGSAPRKDLTWGGRSDIVALLSVLAFLTFAGMMSARATSDD